MVSPILFNFCLSHVCNKRANRFERRQAYTLNQIKTEIKWILTQIKFGTSPWWKSFRQSFSVPFSPPKQSKFDPTSHLIPRILCLRKLTPSLVRGWNCCPIHSLKLNSKIWRIWQESYWNKSWCRVSMKKLFHFIVAQFFL